MTEYARFTRRAGDNVHHSTEDPSMHLVGDVVPDWVDVPANVEGGGRRVVQGHSTITCPCGQHRTRELRLGDDGLCVAECASRGFLWYRRKVA